MATKGKGEFDAEPGVGHAQLQLRAGHPPGRNVRAREVPRGLHGSGVCLQQREHPHRRKGRCGLEALVAARADAAHPGAHLRAQVPGDGQGHPRGMRVRGSRQGRPLGGHPVGFTFNLPFIFHVHFSSSKSALLTIAYCVLHLLFDR